MFRSQDMPIVGEAWTVRGDRRTQVSHEIARCRHRRRVWPKENPVRPPYESVIPSTSLFPTERT